MSCGIANKTVICPPIKFFLVWKDNNNLAAASCSAFFVFYLFNPKCSAFLIQKEKLVLKQSQPISDLVIDSERL